MFFIHLASNLKTPGEHVTDQEQRISRFIMMSPDWMCPVERASCAKRPTT